MVMQRFKCCHCGRQFIKNTTQITISNETKSLIDCLLLERISLAGIARVTQVSQNWKNKLHREIELYLQAESIEIGKKKFIILKKSRKSYRCNLVFCSSLQLIIICLALPIFFISSHYQQHKSPYT